MFTSFFFSFTPVVLDLCFTILRRHPSNKKCNPLIFGIIDKIIAEILVDSKIEKDFATHSTTDDGIPLTSLDVDNFKLPSPGHASQTDVAAVKLNDDDFTSESDDDRNEKCDDNSTHGSDDDGNEVNDRAGDKESNVNTASSQRNCRNVCLDHDCPSFLYTPSKTKTDCEEIGYDPTHVEAPRKQSKEHQEQFKKFLNLLEWANEYPPISLDTFEYL